MQYWRAFLFPHPHQHPNQYVRKKYVVTIREGSYVQGIKKVHFL